MGFRGLRIVPRIAVQSLDLHVTLLPVSMNPAAAGQVIHHDCSGFRVLGFRGRIMSLAQDTASR